MSRRDELPSSARQVTRQTREQQQLEELDALVDLLPVGIGIARDAACTDIRSNEAFARILRIPRTTNASLSAPAAVAPRHFRVLHEGRELLPSELPIQVAAAERRTIRDFEEEVVFSNGESVHLLASATPLFDAEGEVRGAVGAFVDITKLREAEAQRIQIERRLQDAQRLESLGVLAGGIAHDFNNLLTTMLGYASLARLEPDAPAAVSSYLQQIEKAAVHAADLCRQMLAYSGRARFVIEPLDLSKLTQETTALLQSAIGKGSTLRLELEPGLPAVLGDASQLRQVVMNLVINASEAMGESGGMIRVRTGVATGLDGEVGETFLSPKDLADEYVLLSVSDTGCGMPKETVRRIFEPFFSTKVSGRGLGLAAVLGIVRSLHGGLRVVSEPGRGTTFDVMLPRAVDAANERLSEGRGTLAPTAVGTALVVDDEPAVLQVAGRMLGNLGFEVLLAEGGEQALQLFRQHANSVRVVLLDVTMPHWSGAQTLHALRELAPDLFVVLMSGFSDQDRSGAFEQQRVVFLPKPFSVAQLRASLQGAI